MEFRTLFARKEGTCKRCDGPINIGDKIRWAAGRGAYHLSAECPTVTTATVELTPADDETRYADWLTRHGPGGTLAASQPIREVERTVLAQAVKLPDADAMLAAFGVKS